MIYYVRLVAEGDTAERLTNVPGVIVQGVDPDRSEAQAVGVVTTAANRGPVAADVACVVQTVAWIDIATPDKHQRRLHNSIRIS